MYRFPNSPFAPMNKLACAFSPIAYGSFTNLSSITFIVWWSFLNFRTKNFFFLILLLIAPFLQKWDKSTRDRQKQRVKYVRALYSLEQTANFTHFCSAFRFYPIFVRTWTVFSMFIQFFSSCYALCTFYPNLSNSKSKYYLFDSFVLFQIN